jgi:16S rRNA (adenine1518-N6/adenine1519-N6)-dimethyltransferase
VKARKRFGQHFLEPAWARKVVDAIAPGPEDTFLEIGPGRGAITRPLAARARHVVAVELDRDLADALSRERLGGVTVVQGDFLDVDLEALSLPAATRVVGNLPYNVSTPILSRLVDLALAGAPFRDATLMLQKEVAERVMAGPGGKDYGPLAILVALVARVTRSLTLPPGAFRPTPEVTSAVVKLEIRPPGERPVIPAVFMPLVRGIFTLRRKMLSNALQPVASGSGWTARDLLAAAGIDAARRPETLTLEELLRLAQRLSERPTSNSLPVL